MTIITLVIQIAALVCLFLEAFRLAQGANRPSWGWFGLFLWLLSLMVGDVTLHPTD